MWREALPSRPEAGDTVRSTLARTHELMNDEPQPLVGNRIASVAARFSWARWLRLPRFEDEEDERIARVVHVLGIAVLVVTVLPVLHNLAVGNRSSAVVLVLEQVCLVACLWINYHGRPRVAARLIAASAIVMAAMLQAAGRSGVLGVAVLIYPAVIVVSVAVLDRRWFAGMSLLAMVAVAAQYVLELSGVRHYELSHHVEWRQLVDAEIIILVTALAAELLMRSLHDNLDRLRQALHSLRESETLYRTLFESASEAIVVHEIESGALIDFNRRACEMFGYSSEMMRGLSLGDLSVDAPGNRQDDALQRMSTAAQGDTQVFEWQARSSDGRAFWVEIHMRAVVISGVKRVMVSIRDIDERKRAALERQRLEEQLHQAQKMESIGRLAGGVAHDFNNVLTCIGGNAELALMYVEPRHEAVQNLQEIKGAVDRASELTRRLLAFSRKQPIEPRPLELVDLLESTQRMLARLLGEHFQLALDIAPDTRPILADPTQLEQILMNLLVNARDAMPQGGKIKLEVGNITIDTSSAATNPGAHPGAYVRLAVIDAGVGIAERDLPNIFDPFFTTKPVGKGTGLGLSMVLGAVQQNGGFIQVESSPDKGSSFEIFLPIMQGSAPVSLRPLRRSMPAGKERVLLVEDDPSVRKTGTRLLGRLGYNVIACANAEEAIAVVEVQREQFDLLMTDVILPGLDGKALSERLTRALPTMKVLYCSGYTAEVIAHRGVLDNGIAFIAKPFSQETLGRKIRAVLDEEPS